MMRLSLVIFTFISVLFLPWAFSALLAIVSSFSVPFLPLAAGIFADILYYTPETGILPLFTLYGTIATCAVLFVRSRLVSDIIKE